MSSYPDRNVVKARIEERLRGERRVNVGRAVSYFEERRKDVRRASDRKVLDDNAQVSNWMQRFDQLRGGN